jgi:hypothetical protein
MITVNPPLSKLTQTSWSRSKKMGRCRRNGCRYWREEGKRYRPRTRVLKRELLIGLFPGSLPTFRRRQNFRRDLFGQLCRGIFRPQGVFYGMWACVPRAQRPTASVSSRSWGRLKGFLGCAHQSGAAGFQEAGAGDQVNGGQD